MKARAVFLFCFVLFTLSCARRSSLPPEKAMLGQWKSADTYCWIAPGRMTIQDISSGNRSLVNYQIVNVTLNSVTLETGPATKFLLAFADDNKSFTQEREFAGVKLEQRAYRFIDTQQEP